MLVTITYFLVLSANKAKNSTFSLTRLFEVCETVTGIHLVMEMAPNGELFARLSEEGPYKECQAKGIFAQIASAVEYMVRQSTRDRIYKTNLFLKLTLAELTRKNFLRWNTDGQRLTRDLEVVGSNPAGRWAFFFFYLFSLTFHCNKS